MRFFLILFLRGRLLARLSAAVAARLSDFSAKLNEQDGGAGKYLCLYTSMFAICLIKLNGGGGGGANIFDSII